ncbi:MAG: adenylate/guanylate cyclase domain-containing protein, partial [Proteobacteria bacterium]
MRFQKERRKLFRARFSKLTTTVLAPLLLVSVIFDLVAHPKNWIFTTLIRCVLLSAAIGLNKAQRKMIIARSRYFLPMHTLTFLMSLSICTVGLLSGYEPSVYLLRLNLVAILSFCFLPWSTSGLIVSGVTVYLPFALLALFLPSIANHFFLVKHEIAAVITTGLIGYFVNVTTVSDLRKSFEKRLNLFKGGQSKDALIELKTQESVHLERLTTQFSPQVVSAIKSGAISIDTSERRQITIIFLDIENSAARAKILDPAAFEAVLREFFDLVTRVFIKHNITIGTYLGDGLLAFSNAPNIFEDHQLRAARACLDLLERTSAMKPHLDQIWRSNFNIRIGLNSGLSTVGF